jgi:tetraacyldisaccharide-1-P 4'-kinase
VSPSELGTLLAVAGIARPERFIQTLHDAGGVDIGDSLIYDDHRRYGKGEIDTIVARLAQLGAKYVVTTSKDAVKLSRVPELVGRLCVVEVGIEIDREGEVFGMIDRVVARVRSEGV